MLRTMQEHQLRVDEDHAAALEIVLLLADAGARWQEYEHALDLLEVAEHASGGLAPEYILKRRRWELCADNALAG